MRGSLQIPVKVEEGIALAKAQLALTTGMPDERDSHLALATMYTRLKRWQEASAELDKAEALATKPDDKLYVYFLRGSLYDRQKSTNRLKQSFGRRLPSTRRTRPS